jgi:hypothetical protein
MVRICVALATAAGALGLAQPAAGNPATTVAFSAGASATYYNGYAFDACTAPPVSSIQAWASSPYRALAVYMGGVNRTCSQPELTVSWVRKVTALGWKLLPVYKGLQAACGGRDTDAKITHGQAYNQGVATAADAVSRARPLAMLSGSAIYLDIENYTTTDVTCRTDVLAFISGYTRELHRRGYLAGVYANLNFGAKPLSDVYRSTSYARPDVLWIARWDGSTALTGWAGIPDAQWAMHQRAKQFHGDHTETYGGVTINIDSNRVNAPVATVAQYYTVSSATALTARRGPSSSAAAVKSYAPGSLLPVVCQTPGSKVGTSTMWDKLGDGTYVTAYYMRPPSSSSPPLIRCFYPYQVTAPDFLTERSGPGWNYQATGSLPTGSLAWIVCQYPGTTSGSTRVWDRLSDSRWVTDNYVATPSSTTYSAPIPRC